jgi:predicted transcriptional regulator
MLAIVKVGQDFFASWLKAQRELAGFGAWEDFAKAAGFGVAGVYRILEHGPLNPRTHLTVRTAFARGLGFGSWPDLVGHYHQARRAAERGNEVQASPFERLTQLLRDRSVKPELLAKETGVPLDVIQALDAGKPAPRESVRRILNTLRMDDAELEEGLSEKAEVPDLITIFPGVMIDRVMYGNLEVTAKAEGVSVEEFARRLFANLAEPIAKKPKGKK